MNELKVNWNLYTRTDISESLTRGEEDWLSEREIGEINCRLERMAQDAEAVSKLFDVARERFLSVNSLKGKQLGITK